jgi:hypothetical protein
MARARHGGRGVMRQQAQRLECRGVDALTPEDGEHAEDFGTGDERLGRKGANALLRRPGRIDDPVGALGHVVQQHGRSRGADPADLPDAERLEREGAVEARPIRAGLPGMSGARHQPEPFGGGEPHASERHVVAGHEPAGHAPDSFVHAQRPRQVERDPLDRLERHRGIRFPETGQIVNTKYRGTTKFR